jgi:hypothetical protein
MVHSRTPVASRLLRIELGTAGTAAPLSIIFSKWEHEAFFSLRRTMLVNGKEIRIMPLTRELGSS